MIEYLPLERLLDGSRDSSLRSDDAASLYWRQWWHRVGQWRSLLEREAGETWALYNSDAFEFSAALFALWSQRKIACVPGSNQALICLRLQERVTGFIGEFPAAPDRRLLAAPDAHAESLTTPVVLDRLQLAMEIFTSGSSGEPEAVPKALYQLSEEVDNLQHLWATLADETTVAATVSHHHIYGLLFRVLWPLAAGRLFNAHLNDHYEELNRDGTEDQPIVLVSSPSHLSRIPPQTDWTVLRRRCRAIFSSGAPLPREASLSAAQHLGFAPIEVYGSSETGGVAWRQQSAERDVAWEAMPGIIIGIDEVSQCLQIQSPYLTPEPNDQWYLTTDRVKLLGADGFHLLGRADRIAKVEGKRVSLTEMEQRLESHPLVAQARVLVLEGRRSELAAALVLNDAGTASLTEQGRRSLSRLLNDYLLQQFERPVLPRRWRYPRSMPMNSQGKVTVDLLEALFTGPERGRPLLPDVLEVHTDGGKVRLHLHIPVDLLYFQGHFPVSAILPGVVQLKWAKHFGAEYVGFAGDFSHLEAIKFQHVIRPGQVVCLELEFKADRNALAFRYHSAAGQHASGRIANKG